MCKRPQLYLLPTAALTSNPSVACPGDTVTFTCTLPGNEVRWEVTPPPGSSTSDASGIVNSTIPTLSIGPTGFMFQAVYIETSGEMTTATLTTVTEVSTLEGSMVMCNAVGGVMEGPLVITVAGEYLLNTK